MVRFGIPYRSQRQYKSHIEPGAPGAELGFHVGPYFHLKVGKTRTLQGLLWQNWGPRGKTITLREFLGQDSGPTDSHGKDQEFRGSLGQDPCGSLGQHWVSLE